MKRITYILCTLLLFSVNFILSASNIPAIVTLNNGMKFEGVVKKINNCNCVFKTEGGKYHIPLSDIKNIDIYNEENEQMTNNLLSSQDKCMTGHFDAKLYHGKRGAHFALGVTTGIFGIIGVAMIADPHPYNGSSTLVMSKNRNDFNDPMYLSCYKKKAKGRLIASTSLGFAAWIGVILLGSI